MHAIFDIEPCLCPKCYREFGPVFKRFSVLGKPAMALYYYEEAIRNALFLFKGCYDYELRHVFLDYQKAWLRIVYRGYSIIPAPSYRGHDERRGYNHVVEMFSCLNLPIIQAIEKTAEIKQSSLSADERAKVGDFLAWKNGVSITGKKILLVDDVYTTGSTMKAIIRMVSAHHPKCIKVLLMSLSPPRKRKR
ncbi:MAG: ComF family protein [Bacilli bacterium]|nr:ComF family protein [Bacilli bacterium]